MLAWTVRVLATIALGLSTFLWWTSATSETAIGCDWSAFDCDAALASPWAKWLGVPVAAGGTLCYLAALAGSVLAGRSGAAGSTGWRLLELASPLATGAGLWFTFVQASRLDSLCLWCLLTHACGMAMAIAVVLWRRQASDGEATPLAPGLAAVGVASNSGPPSPGIPTIAGLIGLVALVVGQTLGAPATVVEYEPEITTDIAFDDAEQAPEDPATESMQVETPVMVSTAKPVTKPAEPKAAKRQRNGSRHLKLLKGRLTIDAYDHAVLGSPEAPHLVVELMDYACPHCREFHEILHEAINLYDGQVGVVILPVPGENLCNKYITKARPKSIGACYAAKLSIAVSRLEPDGFDRFHSWMLEAESIPSRTSALLRAQRVADNSELSAELRDPDGLIAARIRQYVELAGALQKQGRFGLPTQILGDKVVVGPPDSLEAVCKLWSASFELENPKPEGSL